jgi:hypothetical protein
MLRGIAALSAVALFAAAAFADPAKLRVIGYVRASAARLK